MGGEPILERPKLHFLGSYMFTLYLYVHPYCILFRCIFPYDGFQKIGLPQIIQVMDEFGIETHRVTWDLPHFRKRQFSSEKWLVPDAVSSFLLGHLRCWCRWCARHCLRFLRCLREGKPWRGSSWEHFHTLGMVNPKTNGTNIKSWLNAQDFVDILVVNRNSYQQN